MGFVMNIVSGSFDPELVPLIEAMNSIGIKTIASCSGHGKSAAYIAIDMASLEGVRIQNDMLCIDWNPPSAG